MGGRGPPGRSPSVLQADVAPGPVPLRSADCECLDARKRGTSEAATWGPPRTRTTWRTCRGQAWRQCGRAQGPGLCPETCMRRPARHAPRRVPGASAGPDTRRAGGPCVPAATRFLTCPLTWTLAAPRRGEAPGHALPRPAGPSAQGGGRRVSFPWPRVMRPKPTAFTSDASPFRVRRSQPPAPRPARRPADLLHQPRTADRQAHGPRESHAGWPSEPAPSVHVTHRNRYLRGLSWPSCPGKSSKGQTGKWLRLQHRTPMREPAPNPRTAVKTLLS